MNNLYNESDKTAWNIDQNIIIANNKFALSLIKEIQEDQNIFLSPVSISLTLSMICNGAEGSTRDAILDSLNLKGVNLQTINEAYKNILFSLENLDNQVKFIFSNSIWITKSFKPFIKPNFKEILSKLFKSKLSTCDFNDSQTINEINEWVRISTKDKITKIVDTFNSDSLLYLLNVIYFKGNWTKKFNKSGTSLDEFTLENGTKINVSMMTNEEEFYYYSDDDIQSVRLPYGKEKTSLYIILPIEGLKLDLFIHNINLKKIEKIAVNMKLTDLELKIPKIKLEYVTKQLEKTLTKLGMGIIFDKTADFQGIVSGDKEFFVSSISQKAIIEINEEGTEAAAVTAMGWASSEPSSNLIKFIVNRPYFFFIRDDRSGIILFMGKIVNPSHNTL